MYVGLRPRFYLFEAGADSNLQDNFGRSLIGILRRKLAEPDSPSGTHRVSSENIDAAGGAAKQWKCLSEHT